MLGVMIGLAVTLPRLLSLAPSPVELPQGYPATLEAVSSFTLTISPSGQVEGCRLLATSGWPILDAKGCPVLAKARFAPAADSSGAPADGVVDVQVKWPQGEVVLGSTSPDVELTLERMPVGVTGRPVSDLAVTIGLGGAPEGCEVVHSSGSGPLDTAACAAAMKSAGQRPVKAANGSPVRAIRAVSVRFVAYPRLETNRAGKRLGDFYPERELRLGVTGFAIARCQASAVGSLDACSIVEYSPRGYEFGLATLSLIKTSKIRLATGQEGEVFIPVKFNLGSNQVPSPAWVLVNATPLR